LEFRPFGVVFLIEDLVYKPSTSEKTDSLAVESCRTAGLLAAVVLSVQQIDSIANDISLATHYAYYSAHIACPFRAVRRLVYKVQKKPNWLSGFLLPQLIQ
jgi:hypothetical protein